MFSRIGSSRMCAVVACLALVGLLAGCGGGLRVIKPEIDDAAAIRAASAFHVKPVVYDFTPDPDWEIPASDWPTKTREWNTAFADWTGRTDAKAVYTLGPGSDAKEGAVIELTVTQMKLGHYAFFSAGPGRIWGKVTITDAKSGTVIFRGSLDSPGSTGTSDVYSYEGRVKTAHEPVARDLRWLIERTE